MEDNFIKRKKFEELQLNRAYSLFMLGTQVIGRYKGERIAEGEQCTFYNCLHYSKSMDEVFCEENTFSAEIVDEIRLASIAEKRLLMGYEIQQNLI